MYVEVRVVFISGNVLEIVEIYEIRILCKIKVRDLDWSVIGVNIVIVIICGCVSCKIFC